MPLPDLIEIVPLDKPVRAEITVPGSKSITNRALVLAALADGETTLTGALWSEDTQVMVECLQDLGFMVNVTADPNEFCNRTITVYGKGGNIPHGGTVENPLELFVGNAGTAARFLAAMVCLGSGVYRLTGVPRMHERPQAALFKALRELGYRVDSPNDKLPAVIHGGGIKAGKCNVSIEESSQFASALLLCAKHGGWNVKIVGENAEESPYIVMTTQLLSVFPNRGGSFQIEADASSGSYFVGAGWLLSDELSIKVNHWPDSDWQMDSKFPSILDPKKRKESIKSKTPLGLTSQFSRRADYADSIMTCIVLFPAAAPFFDGHIGSDFTDLGRLRLQECDRVLAMHDELKKCGADILMTPDGETLSISFSQLHGSEIETYNDHRMAMCFAILGLKVAGIRLKNPACVKKTFPNFFQKLAAQPPHGLGAEIHDGKTRRKLTHEELFAD